VEYSTLAAVDPLPSATPVLTLNLSGVWRSGDQIIGLVSLGCEPGETLAIVGPSGIGKTTLLRVAAGLQQNFKGTCQVTDRKALVFQEPRLLPWRTVLKNLTIATGVDDAAALQLLNEAGLDGKADLLPSQISLGQQRRVALMRAFATEPELLLMDEPFVSLDTDTAASMMKLFANMRDRRNVATLLVTHSLEEARRLATRIVTLAGRPATIQSDVQNTLETVT